MRLLISILFVFVSAAVVAQPVVQWQSSYGGTGDDDADCVQMTLTGGFVLAGISSSAMGASTVYHGGGDFGIVNTDALGNIIWQNTYGGSSLERARCIRPTKDSGFIAVGYAGSADGDVAANYGDVDFWVVKLDKDGHLVWAKNFGGSKADEANAVVPTFDGGFIVAGFTLSHDSDVTGFHTGTGADCWVIKLDDTGRLQWQKTYGGTDDDVASEIIQTADSNYVMTGFTASADGDVTHQNGLLDMWLVKLDDTGRIIWQHTYGGSGADAAYSVKQTGGGGYIVAGSTNSADNGIVSRGGTYWGDYWVVKTDDTGGLQWQKTYGGSRDECVQSVQHTLDGGFVLGGWTNSPDGDVVSKHDTTDYWVVKIDDTGYIQWQKTLGGSGADAGTGMVQCADSSYVIAGHTNSADGDVTTHLGGDDYWVVRLGKARDMALATGAKSNIRVYPTLTRGSVTIGLPRACTGAAVSVTNMMGQCVAFSQVSGQMGQLFLDAQLPNGMYILEVSGGSERQFFKIDLCR